MDHASVDFYQVQTIISFTGIFIFGIIAFLKSPGNRLNVAAAAFFIFVSLWQLDLFIIRGAQTLSAANITSRILRPALFFVPVTLLSFAILLTKNRGKALYLEKIVWLIAVTGSLMCFTGIGFKPMVYKPGIGYNAQADTTYLMIIINNIISIAGVFTVLLRKYLSKDILSQEKKQMQYLLLGVGIGFAGAMINIMNIYGMKIFPVAGFFVLIFFALMAYSILAHDLMNIRELFQKTLMYILTAALIVIIYVFADLLLLKNTGNNLYKIFMFFVCTIFIVLGFEPTLKALDKITRKAFFISNYDFQVLLQHVLLKIRFLKEFEEIFAATAGNVMNILKIRNSVFFFWDTQRECFILHAARKDEGVCLPAGHPLIAYMCLKKDLVYYKKLQDDIAYDMTLGKTYRELDVLEMTYLLKAYDAELCLPVLVGGEVKGIWIIGEKTNKAIFTREEINWVKNIAAQVSAVVENIILYTQLLKSERFAMIGRMSAAIAHEIRNPLTGLDGFVQMVNSDRGNSEALNRFLKIAPGEFKRLERLTDNLLALSRTTVVRQEEKELPGIIDEVIDFTSHMLRDRKIAVNVNYLPVPKVYVETEQIKQLILNIIINASQAVEKNGLIEITVSEGKILDKRYVTAAFSDTGPGIAAETFGKIFEPFFTTKAEGTGLGLAISRNIMEAHGGIITAENNERKGCTIKILFPIR